MVGILVHGSNHFIVRGPLPDRATAQALARHWSIIQIGGTTPTSLQGWRIVTHEFRENLEWAVVVSSDDESGDDEISDDEITPAVAQLLDELSARGIAIHKTRIGY